MIITLIIFITSIIINFFLYRQIKEINILRTIEKNSYKEMFNIEVAQKRIYYNLSEKLIYENRELKQENKVLLMKNSRLFRLLRK